MYEWDIKLSRKEKLCIMLIGITLFVVIFGAGYMLGIRNAGINTEGLHDNGSAAQHVREELGSAGSGISAAGSAVSLPSADKNFSALINPDIYEFIATHRDKILHFLAGVVITGVVFCATGIPAYGFAAALFTGTMKELRDWGCYLGFSWKDMVATWISGFFGLAFLMAVQSV